MQHFACLFLLAFLFTNCQKEPIETTAAARDVPNIQEAVDALLAPEMLAELSASLATIPGKVTRDKVERQLAKLPDVQRVASTLTAAVEMARERGHTEERLRDDIQLAFAGAASQSNGVGSKAAVRDPGDLPCYEALDATLALEAVGMVICLAGGGGPWCGVYLVVAVAYAFNEYEICLGSTYSG
ncbi:hypothetical protein GGR28_002404 [Lewinella aquimaris]|uniref:Uncharacterized protein n=1 Tax=Neolewinella aquimaris TaxID=1835722 RepID=A0A840E8X5_9BACT|nr:hypothetical protein [Neolewinella aquimaris]MBB4079777.1 hypothetical protein [Neolewinella aquimaris]